MSEYKLMQSLIKIQIWQIYYTYTGLSSVILD